MKGSPCPYCGTHNPADAACCANCGRWIAGAPTTPGSAELRQLAWLLKLRVTARYREPLEERLLWALALSLPAFLGIAAFANLPAVAAAMLGSLLLLVVGAGLAYRYYRCGMFTRRFRHAVNEPGRTGLLLAWGWSIWLLIALRGWSPGTPPDPVPALAGAWAIGLLVLDEWRGLGLLAAFGLAVLGGGIALGRLAPYFAGSIWGSLLLPLALWYALAWLFELTRTPA